MQCTECTISLRLIIAPRCAAQCSPVQSSKSARTAFICCACSTLYLVYCAVENTVRALQHIM